MGTLEDANIASSTVGQLFNFTVFIAALILFVNNLFSFTFRADLFDGIERTLYLVEDSSIVLASFLLLYLSILSPYDDIINYGVKTQNLITVVYLACLLIVSTSSIIEDPRLLLSESTSVFDPSDFVGDLTSVQLDIDLILDDDLQAFGLIVVTLVNFSKIVTFFAALLYGLLVLLRTWPTINRGNVIKTFRIDITTRVIYLIVIISSGVIWFKRSIGFTEEQREPLFTTYQTTLTLLGETDASGINSVAYQYYIKLLSTVGMFVLAAYITIVYRNPSSASLIIFFASLTNLVILDELVDDSPLFNYVFLIMMFALSASVMVIIEFLFTQSYSGLFLTIPNVLYKVGNIFNVLSAPFLILSISYSWVDFRFAPNSNLTGSTFEVFINASESIETVVDRISDVGQRLDPCSKSVFQTLPVDDDLSDSFTAISSVAQLDTEFRNVREDLFNDADDPLNTCVIGSGDFPFRTDIQVCSNLKDDQTNTRSSFKQNEEISGSLDIEYEELEVGTIVNAECRNKQCESLLVLGVAAIGIANIPFMGGVGYGMGLAARAANVVYKVGRTILRVIKKLRTRANTLRKLARTISKLVKVTRNSLKFKPEHVIILLPVILGAIVSLAILMFRRNVYVEAKGEDTTKPIESKTKIGNTESKTESNKNTLMVERTKRKKQTSGFVLAIGIFLPLFMSSTVFLVFILLFDNILDSVIGALPEILVKADVSYGIGFTALEFAYWFSSVGNFMLLLSALLYAVHNNVFSPSAVIKRFDTDKTAVYTSASIVIPHANRLNFRQKLAARTVFLLNWEQQWLQPLIFMLPAVVLFIHSVYMVDQTDVQAGLEDRYISILLNSNAELNDAREEVSETLVLQADSAAVDQDLNEFTCGLAGKIVLAILNAIPGGGIRQLQSDITAFVGNLNIGFDGAALFFEALKDLGSGVFYKVDFALFSSRNVELMFVYSIPLINFSLLFFVWLSEFLGVTTATAITSGITLSGLIDLLIEDILTSLVIGVSIGIAISLWHHFGNKRINFPLWNFISRKIVRKGDSGDVSIEDTIPVFLFYSSLIQITIHLTIGNMIKFVGNSELPFIQLSIQTDTLFLKAVCCGLFGIISAMIVYLNTVLPPN